MKIMIQPWKKRKRKKNRDNGQEEGVQIPQEVERVKREREMVMRSL